MVSLSTLLNNSKAYSKKKAFTTSEGVIKSYADLFQGWNEIQSVLINNEYTNQKRIGILLSAKDKSLECIGGILLSKNVYVPLDFNAPISRNLHIIRDNCLHGLFVDGTIYKENQNQFPDHEISLLDAMDFVFLSFKSVDQVEGIPTDLAYILNTSGSTGKPKGVMIRHENAVSFINWASDKFEFSANDKFTSIAPFHFDLSIFDLYVSIKHGASLLFLEPDDIKNPMLLAKKIADEQITVMYATPTVLMLLLRYGKLHKYDFSKLRYVFFAGEVFPIEQLKQLKRIWSHVQFGNWYGPTETNVCTYFEVPEIIENQEVPFPIGKECLSQTTKIATNGELLVTGSLVTPGYWNNPQKNQSAFTTDTDNRKWYKTGDIVILDDDGNYVFKGRKDRMIKRRGYRIELDELEHIVRNYPAVQDAAIISTKNKKDALVIICYYTANENSVSISAADFRDYLLESVPLYMLPDKYIVINQLPKTSTQKIDYQSLMKNA